MKTAAVGGLLWALAALLGTASGCERKGCSEASANPNSCYCPTGEACTHSCPSTASSCSLGCGNGNGACAVSCGDNCSAACQGATSCDATCGANCQIACQHVAQACTAVVGDNSTVQCEGAPACDITCSGACDVLCAEGHCRVKCADPARCNVLCDRTGLTATVCPDGVTKVCGEACD